MFNEDSKGCDEFTARMRKTLLQYEMHARTSNKPGSGAKPKPMGRSCRAAFIPILKSKCVSIEQTTRGAHQYGPTDRHMLNVYYPPTPCPNTLILAFSYGGGFYMGARMHPTPLSIIYYNSAPSLPPMDSSPFVKFPGTAQDMQDAIQWLMDDLPFPDSGIHVLGHLMDMFTVLAPPELFSPTLHPRIGERDIPCLHPTMEKFGAALRVSYDEFAAKGHNHISLMFALGTGQGKEWAEDAVKWTHACRELH
ncbi:uncharacterized protein EV420DRAFT_1726804 [Desarmillaria tabescens]|uniref:Alpha/beta-hydrolase n=1 Tax=Armillaria tabescens TaxID=1929756 RepID=A0AA39MR46_ARMTA|nr:uncharacterized protein EV420DRAFT_1726804 [Desarmillaria tabescens]KAK0442760.1 hypothetical protein EV420DRAFT_1726804 [Desarmillaria tabescens]